MTDARHGRGVSGGRSLKTAAEALAALRREGSHLARAVDDQGTTVGLVALEDLVEEYVGTVRDSTHVTRSGARS